MNVRTLALDATKALINNPPDVVNEDLLNLLSTGLGFPSFERVKYYTEELCRQQWCKELKDDIGYLKFILSEMGVPDFIERIADEGDYETLVMQIRLYPEYAHLAANRSIAPSITVDTWEEIGYKPDIGVITDLMNRYDVCRFTDDNIRWMFTDNILKGDDIQHTSWSISVIADKYHIPDLVPWYGIILNKFLDDDENDELRDAIQDALYRSLFSIYYVEGDEAENVPSEMLEVLVKNGFDIYPPPRYVRVNTNILSNYVGHDEEDIRRILMDTYGASVTAVDIREAIHHKNYSLAREWMNDNPLLDVETYLIESDYGDGLIWLTMEYEMNPETMGHYYMKAQGLSVVDALVEMGIKLDVSLDEFLNYITRRYRSGCIENFKNMHRSQFEDYLESIKEKIV